MKHTRFFVVLLPLLAGSACGPEFNTDDPGQVAAPDARNAAGTGASSGRAGQSGAPAGSAGLEAVGGSAGTAGEAAGGMAGAGGSTEDAGATLDASLDALEHGDAADAAPADAQSDRADAASSSDALSDRPMTDTTLDAASPPDACTSTTFYLDGDADGYGGTSVSQGCEPPAVGRWVTSAGDCDDNNAVVHPGQTNFFVQGYTKTGGSQVSFDYDCNDRETESGNSPKGSCHVVGLNCVGAGYLVASPPRSGPGVDPYCGSKESVNCTGGALNCRAGTPFQAPPIACR